MSAAERLADEIEAISSIYEPENVRIDDSNPLATLVTVTVTDPNLPSQQQQHQNASPSSYCALLVTVHLPRAAYLTRTQPAPLATFSFAPPPPRRAPAPPALSDWLPAAAQAEARAQLAALYAQQGPTGGEVLFEFLEWLRGWVHFPSPAASLRESTAAAAAEAEAAEAAAEAAALAAAEAAAAGAGGSEGEGKGKGSNNNAGGAAASGSTKVDWREAWAERGIMVGPTEVHSKSRFTAFMARVESAQDVKTAVAALLLNPDLQVATHNMYAYRFTPSPPSGGTGSVVVDADEDGEAGAEHAMLFYVNAAAVHNCLIMVSRWYGGIMLGPKRFAIIKNVMRDGYVMYCSKTGGNGAGAAAAATGKGKK